MADLRLLHCMTLPHIAFQALPSGVRGRVHRDRGIPGVHLQGPQGPASRFGAAGTVAEVGDPGPVNTETACLNERTRTTKKNARPLYSPLPPRLHYPLAQALFLAQQQNHEQVVQILERHESTLAKVPRKSAGPRPRHSHPPALARLERSRGCVLL